MVNVSLLHRGSADVKPESVWSYWQHRRPVTVSDRYDTYDILKTIVNNWAIIGLSPAAALSYKRI